MSYRQHWDLSETSDSTWDARRQLAEAIRQLADRCVMTDASEDAIRSATQQLTAITQALPPGKTAGAHWSAGTYQQEVRRFIDRTALMGQANPVAPPMIVSHDGSASICEITLGERFVGAPGLCHGGVIAAIYDQLLGHAVLWAERSGLTVDLQITYRRPTPLHTPLRFTARVDRTQGRSTYVSGTCHRGDTLLSTSVGHFVRLNPGKAAAVFGASEP